MPKKDIAFLIICIIFVSLAFVLTNTGIVNKIFASNSELYSPLPSLLTETFSTVKGVYHWVPNILMEEQNIRKKPEFSAVSVISYDVASDRLLYEKDIKKRYPIASLTKIMTAIIALENEKPDKVYTVSKHASEIGENTMGLSFGEKVTLEELLYGLILHSANDAAETIASSSQFGRENFIYVMNKKAEEMGLTDTNFTNPTGLEGDGNQYGTVYDMLIITKYALKNETFAKVAATVEYTIPATDTHKEFILYNQTNLLTTYPGVKGIKTGYTDEAGMCLITYLDYENHKIIAILLNSQNRRQEMIDLLDYSLKSLGTKPPPHS